MSSASFVEKTALYALNGLGTFVENHLTISTRVYLGFLFCSFYLSGRAHHEGSALMPVLITIAL